MRFPAGIRRGWAGAVCLLLLAFLSAPAANARPQGSASTSTGGKVKTTTKKKRQTTTPASSGKSAVTTRKGKRGSRHRVRGQQKIDSERARAIQAALIREHYLTGVPTGAWNQASQDAMRRYQGDHGWQSKTVPDSRALIKLGLGPSKDHLLNPESAMTTAPDAPRAASLNPVSHSPGVGAPPSKIPPAVPPPASMPNQDSSSPQ